MIPVYQPLFEDDDKKAMFNAIESGWISSLGSFVDTFEQKFAEYVGTSNAICTSNGTTALHLVLDSLGIGPGDEVIVPDLTFIATANAVKYTGAEVVTCDVDPNYLTICTKDLKTKISKKTKAIIPVHLYGHPADMDEIIKISKQYKLYVIEDAAEAHGATYNGKRVGSFGIAAAFSFYGNKIITTGEGGMITSNSDLLSEKMRLKRDHAMSKEKRYFHETVGFNYRMTNVQASLGCSQLAKIEKIILRKREIFSIYSSLLNLDKSISLNKQAKNAESVFWLINLHTTLRKDQIEKIQASLKKKGIDTRPFFVPISLNPPYKHLKDCLHSRRIYESSFSLPSGPTLSNQQIEYVALNVNEILKNVS